MNYKNVLSIFFLVAVLFISAQESKEEIIELLDVRDGQKYKTVTFHIMLAGDVTVERTWMAQNLNYKVLDSFCYNNESAYCKAYGRLYTFQAATDACPEGWHIPSIEEWNLLFNAYGGNRESGLALQKGGQSKLDLLPGGFGDPGGRIFKKIGISGNYWDAEKKSSNTSGLISVQKGAKTIYHSVIGNWHRNSCRCVKDYE